MLTAKDIATLQRLVAKIETANEVETLYKALQPHGFQLPHDSEWVEKKLNAIWNRANKFNVADIPNAAKDATWKAAGGGYKTGNFKTFELLANEYFAINGTKEKRIAQLIKLIDFKWFQGKEAVKEIEKAKNKGWQIKSSEKAERDTCYVIDLTKPFKFRGICNSMKIEELITLLDLPKIEIPYYGEWSVRQKADNYSSDFIIYYNGNIELKSQEFHKALKPYVKQWFDSVWHTICYKE